MQDAKKRERGEVILIHTLLSGFICSAGSWCRSDGTIWESIQSLHVTLDIALHHSQHPGVFVRMVIDMNGDRLVVA